MPLFRDVEGLSQRFNECVGLLQSDCFSLVMNMTLLRTRIIVIALMAGFALGQGHMKSDPAEGDREKAVEAGQGSRGPK
jgi:hypothetical protein